MPKKAMPGAEQGPRLLTSGPDRSPASAVKGYAAPSLSAPNTAPRPESLRGRWGNGTPNIFQGRRQKDTAGGVGVLTARCREFQRCRVGGRGDVSELYQMQRGVHMPAKHAHKLELYVMNRGGSPACTQWHAAHMLYAEGKSNHQIINAGMMRFMP